mgnify:FL=1
MQDEFSAALSRDGRDRFLFASLLSGFGEELSALGEAVWLQKHTEDHRAIWRYCLMHIAGWSPAELAWATDTLVILQRTFQDIGLLDRRVLVQWHYSAGLKFE